jgi:hypothetical protein
MNQILHIFRKDARRHYAEILISLVLLALFTHRQLQFWLEGNESVHVGSLMFFQITRLITPILVLFWAFLIVRVVQAESLVGDRQWWTTKPYDWWKLLLAKLLFIFVFISIPLMLVQLFLLHHAGYSIFPNLRGVLLMQFTLPLLVILFSLVLACLTRNLSQAMLGVGLVLVVMIAVSWLSSELTRNTMDESSKFSQAIQGFLTFGSVILVPIWQFARRKTWASRGTLVASFGVATLISLIPSGHSVEQSHPLVAAKDSPVQFAIPAIPEAKKGQAVWPDYMSTAALIIPANVSAVAPGTMVLIDGINITSDSPEDSNWSRGWSGQYLQVWPEDQRKDLTYALKRKEYEGIKSKPLNLHIQLLLSEYQETDPRTLLVPISVFRDSYLGICRVTPLAPNAIQCLKPFQSRSYIARFDAPNSHCAPPKEYPRSNLAVAYAWQPPGAEFLADPGLNPMVDYSLTFNSVSRVSNPNASTQPAYSVATLCPGAEIRLARPVFKRQLRIQLDLPNTRLQDLVQGFPGGGPGGAVSIGL